MANESCSRKHLKTCKSEPVFIYLPIPQGDKGSDGQKGDKGDDGTPGRMGLPGKKVGLIFTPNG